MRSLRSSYVLMSLLFCAKGNRVVAAPGNICGQDTRTEPPPSSPTDGPTQSLPNLTAPFAVLGQPGPSSSTDDSKQSWPNQPGPSSSTHDSKHSWPSQPGQSSYTDDSKKSWPSLAVFSNELQKGITDGELSSDMIYDNFIRSTKWTLIEDLKRTYRNVHDFYYTPKPGRMPDCFSTSPAAKTFVTAAMDVRLESKKLQVEEELRAFLEGQGFVIQQLEYVAKFHHFQISLQLDVARYPTIWAHEEIEKKLLALESVERRSNDS